MSFRKDDLIRCRLLAVFLSGTVVLQGFIIYMCLSAPLRQYPRNTLNYLTAGYILLIATTCILPLLLFARYILSAVTDEKLQRFVYRIFVLWIATVALNWLIGLLFLHQCFWVK